MLLLLVFSPSPLPAGGGGGGGVGEAAASKCCVNCCYFVTAASPAPAGDLPYAFVPLLLLLDHTENESARQILLVVGCLWQLSAALAVSPANNNSRSACWMVASIGAVREAKESVGQIPSSNRVTQQAFTAKADHVCQYSGSSCRVDGQILSNTTTRNTEESSR